MQRQNALRRILNAYFDGYLEEEENPTIAGFLEYAAVEDELDSDEQAGDPNEEAHDLEKAQFKP